MRAAIVRARKNNTIAMGLSDEGEESVLQRYEELCLDLNMDKNAKEDAWQSYQRIRTNFTLEVVFLAKSSHVACI